ncbi:MAG: glycosyltransferase family 4 protein [Candidatus Sungbacteria bacterium]|uniref:Glycosyltransferase family 4 protein n=1 Tax=Candidatus Sungiibacteriota bacterium TaxID=2750080 RepID=A0A932YVS8_9BACT|nr:glycosyltransferase family 4 protein [Candidatus Sungbacteria bacterium]
MEAGRKPAIFACTTAYYPFVGGAEIAIQEVSRRITDEFSFFIVTARLRSDLPKREARPEGTIIRIGWGTPFDKWILPLLIPFAVRRERDEPGTILWGMDVSAGALGAAIAKVFSPGARFILTIQYGYGGRRLRRGRLGVIGLSLRWMLGRADAVTAISKYLAGEAAHFGYRRPVALFHNGVSIDAFSAVPREKKRENGPMIITVSRLVPKNGVDILIRAVAQIRKSVPDVYCHILGSGPERPRLEELARRLGVGPAVTFLGSVPYADLPRYLAAADVFVRPARSEGMGNAFVEALAAGLPIVGTPVEGILDIIEDGRTGLFARVDDPADVAEKTLRLLRDVPLSRRIADAGRAMVRERFSWDAIAAGYKEAFRDAMLPRILIATPMLPPDIGGPGAYALKLADKFFGRGHRVSILSYGSRMSTAPGTGIVQTYVPLSAPLPVRLFRYGFAAWRMLGDADIAIALDPVAVGRPLAVACRMSGKPFIIRVEGDALWERYVERTGREFTLKQFYGALARLSLSPRERAWQRMSQRVFPRAKRIVFSSRWRNDIFQAGYSLRPEQAALIRPPYPGPERRSSERNRAFVFAGRFVGVKNLPRLIRAFAAACPPPWRLLLIGAGPQRTALKAEIRASGAADRIRIRPALPTAEVGAAIASAHAVLLPSLSDVSPNVILDCIETGTPFLLTKETGFYEALKDIGIFVDPLDEADIAAKLRILMDSPSYAAYCERLREFRGGRSWDDVAGDWLKVIRDSL